MIPARIMGRGIWEGGLDQAWGPKAAFLKVKSGWGMKGRRRKRSKDDAQQIYRWV